MFYIVIKIKYIFTSFHTSNYYSLFINLFFKFNDGRWWSSHKRFTTMELSDYYLKKHYNEKSNS